MNTQPDLEDTIISSIEDAEMPLEEPDLDTSDDLPEVAPEPTTTDSEPAFPVAEAEDSPEVKSPAAKATEAPKGDDFEKRFGIPQNSGSGRENRIPYSRVKKITQKAENEASERVRGEYVPKITEFETKIKDYEAKVTDYEGRLTKVAEFEQVMEKDPVRFIGMLASHYPQYAQIFGPLYEQAKPEEPKTEVPDPAAAPRPEPDVDMPDGSKAYSMEGLDKLNAWNRAQAVAEARKVMRAEIDAEFKPIRDREEAQARINAALPQVEAQINEARKWAKFTENEDEIVKALNADQTLTLEGAYNKVVVPKLVQASTAVQTDTEELRKKIRAEVLAELKKSPRATAATAGATKPTPKVSTGPRDLESIIGDAIKDLPR